MIYAFGFVVQFADSSAREYTIFRASMAGSGCRIT